MKLPQWAKPLDSKTARYCECDSGYLAICVVKIPFMGRTLTFRLCPACVVYERLIRDEITYTQTTRWVKRLRPVLTVRRDEYKAAARERILESKRLHKAKKAAAAKQKETAAA